jgi:hypothetical protein
MSLERMNDSRKPPARRQWAWTGRVLAIYEGVRRAYSDMNANGSAVFWVTSSAGFSIDRNPQDVGFPWASIWQGMYDVTQTYNGVAINIDVDVAAMTSPSSP